MTESQSGITAHLTHFPMAVAYSMCTPRIEVDGVAYLCQWKVPQFIPTTPGRHSVKVYFPYLTWPECGAATIVVDVPVGGVAEVHYNKDTWAFTAGKLTSPWMVPMPSEAQLYAQPYEQQQSVAAQPAVAAAQGWHPDPSGRHQLRYWDGTAWTEHVSTNGVQSSDPI